MSNQIKSGAAWLFGGNFVARLLNIVAMVVLARLLMPADFGLVALAAVSWELLKVFFAGSINIVIIQARDKGDEFFDTAFLISQGLSLLLLGFTFLIAPLAASYYSSASLPHVLYVLAVSYGIGGLFQVQVAILTRDLKFNVISIINLVAQAVESLLMIGLAALGAGYWSLVVPQLIVTVPVGLVYFRISAWRPRLRFSREQGREIIRLSSRLLLTNIVNYLNLNADYLIVGRMLGQAQLGLYRFGYNLAQWPINNVVYQINNLSLPYFAGIRHDAEFSRQQYLKMIRISAITLFPVFVGAALVAPEAFPLVFGEKWLPAAPVFQMICCLGIFQSLGSPGGQIFFGRGRAGTVLAYNLVLLPFLLGGLLIGAGHGITGVALASLIVLGAGNLVFVGLVMRMLEVKVGAVVSALRPAVVSSAVMAAAVGGVIFLTHWQPWLHLAAALAAVLASYLLALRLHGEAWAELRELLASTIANLRKTPPPSVDQP